MTRLLLLLALGAGAIEVYDNGHRVGVANPVINCKPPARCFIEGNAVRIGADAGSGGSLPTPPVCGQDGGSALGWDGGQFLCADVVKAGGAGSSYIEATLTATQGTHLTAGDHIIFDVARVSGGSLITLDTATTYATTTGAASKGRFTLKGGHTYRLLFWYGYIDCGSNDYAHFTFWNADSNAAIGQSVQAQPATSPFNNFGGGFLMAYFPAASDTKIEVRITAASGGLTAFGQVSSGNHFPTALIEVL